MINTEYGIGISGIGRCFPANKIDNQEIAAKLGITAEQIKKHSEIETRYFASPEEPASLISIKASEEALSHAGIRGDQIGLVIGCTSTGDYIFPSVAAKVHHAIGAIQGGAFDISASAASFAMALGIARDRMLVDSSIEHALIFGTAVQSPFIDWNNPQLAAILGDASAAVVVSRVPKDYGILVSHAECHGHNFEAARMRGGGSSFPYQENTKDFIPQYIEMDGLTMGREFVKEQPKVIRAALDKAGLKMDDVDLCLSHQANLRLLKLLMNNLKLPWSKTSTSFQYSGNIAEASLPACLFEALQDGKLKDGSIVVFSALGAGCILAATVMRWYDFSKEKSN